MIRSQQLALAQRQGGKIASAESAEQRAPAYSWYVLCVLIVCYGIYNVDKSIVSVVLEPLRREFLMSDSQLGLLTGLAQTLPFAITCIPLGVLADRVRRQR